MLLSEWFVIQLVLTFCCRRGGVGAFGAPLDSKEIRKGEPQIIVVMGYDDTGQLLYDVGVSCQSKMADITGNVKCMENNALSPLLVNAVAKAQRLTHVFGAEKHIVRLVEILRDVRGTLNIEHGCHHRK